VELFLNPTHSLPPHFLPTGTTKITHGLGNQVGGRVQQAGSTTELPHFDLKLWLLSTSFRIVLRGPQVDRVTRGRRSRGGGGLTVEPLPVIPHESSTSSLDNLTDALSLFLTSFVKEPAWEKVETNPPRVLVPLDLRRGITEGFRGGAVNNVVHKMIEPLVHVFSQRTALN
jgi:hypothetical protein